MKNQNAQDNAAAAGFRGSARDCVCRSIAIASGRPYAEIYARLATENGKERKRFPAKKVATAREGIHTRRVWFRRFMRELGFEWTPTMQIGSGCVVHLDARELPPGRLVVSLSKHCTAMIDGEIFDNHDPRRPMYCDGVLVSPGRCVYGYWKLKESAR